MIAEKKAWSIPGGLMILLFLAALAAAIWSLVSRHTGERTCASGRLSHRPGGDRGPHEGIRDRQSQRRQGPHTLREIHGHVEGTRPAMGESIHREEAGFVAHAELRNRQAKVNDFDGNPIEIAAVVVWQVTETAEAIFQVDIRELHASAERVRAAQYGHLASL